MRELFSVSGSRLSSPDLTPEKIRTGELSGTYQVGSKGFVETASTTDSSNKIPRQAQHKGTLGVSIYLLERRMVVTPRVNIVGARPGVITGPIQEVPSYISFNLSLVLKDVGMRGLYWQVVAYNLANADILDPGFRTAIGDHPAAHPQPGFHMFAKVGYSRHF